MRSGWVEFGGVSAKPQTLRVALLVAFGLSVSLLAVPHLLTDYQLYTVNLVQINVLLAISLNLVIGVARQFALFTGALFGVGAYVAALAQMRLGIPFLPSLPIAVAAATLVSALASLVAWRSGGLYLAMITFGFGEVFQFMLMHADAVTNGPDGLAVPRPIVVGVAFATPASLFQLFLPITVAAIALYRVLETGAIGRLMTALGDSEVALASIGYDPRVAKTIAFAIQGAYAGLAGAFYAAAVGFIDPYSFGLGVTLQQLTAIAVGGFGSLAGAVVGGAVLTLIERAVMDFPGVREIAYALALLFVFLVFPTGLAGLLARLRRSS